MFFSADLLARRDSGFGLLWLAATLGSKSSVKKLSKRSVLDADITHLCELISAPAEPLALRLSSNLMFGVVRVYKVKQELFMLDVGNCVTSLKKVVQELRPSETCLQMANPVARVSTVTLSTEPMNAYILALDADWDSYANVHPETNFSALGEESNMVNSDLKKSKKKRPSNKPAPETEVARRDPHTLEEHHEHLLSVSFDASFHVGNDNDPSSSQMDGGFDFFPLFSDLLDVGDGLGDDLAREIGWNTSPAKSVASHRILPSVVGTPARPGSGMGPIPDFVTDRDQADVAFDFEMDIGAMPQSRFGTPCPVRGQSIVSAVKENSIPPPFRLNSVVPPGTSPRLSFPRLFLSQDLEEIGSLRDITTEDRNHHNTGGTSRKNKRTRLLLDARTELTDEELKVARSKYAQSQADIRRELLEKRLQKESLRYIEDRIWGAPSDIRAPELADFWRGNFKVQVEAKSGVIHIHSENLETEQPVKKRKTTHPAVAGEDDVNIINDFGGPGENTGVGYDGMEDINDAGLDAQLLDGDVGMMFEDNAGFRQSSEEPGQARHLSHAPSLDIADIIATPAKAPSLRSQKTSFFPWDHAGSSSSVDVGFAFGGSDIVPEADVRLRSRSLSQPRAGSLVPSRRGSVTSGLSPVISMHGSQLLDEDFVFDVGTQGVPEATQQETQESEMNMIALERNSANFLEYAKMQYQGLSHRQGYLAFENIVPKETSTRHVAAAAFYHCLVLATKDALRLEQPDATASIRMRLK